MPHKWDESIFQAAQFYLVANGKVTNAALVNDQTQSTFQIVREPQHDRSDQTQLNSRFFKQAEYGNIDICIPDLYF